jgi:type IV secretion system protein VirB5
MAALLLSIGLVVSPVASAGGIPVIDAAAIAKSVEQLVQMKTQIDNQIEQIGQMKAQIKSLTGTRNLGNLLKDAVKDQVPDEWDQIYKAAKSTDYKVLINGKKYDPDNHRKQVVSQYNTIKSVFDGMKKQNDAIKQLMNTINLTEDPKAIAELQARIGAEQAKLQNGQTKLAMFKEMMDIQKQINAYQRQEIQACQARNMRTRDYSSCM